MIRSAYSIGLILTGLAGPYAIIEFFVQDYVLSLMVYGTVFLLVVLLLSVGRIS